MNGSFPKYRLDVWVRWARDCQPSRFIQIFTGLGRKFVNVLLRSYGYNERRSKIMKKIMMVMVMVMLVSISGLAGTNVVVDGKQYRNVEYQRIEGDEIIVFHAGGIARFVLSSLNEAQRISIGLPNSEDLNRMVGKQSKVVKEQRKQNSSRLVSVKVDKFRGTRSYETTSELSLNRELSLAVRTYDEDVVLHFTYSSSEWKFLKYHPFVFLVDGERMSWDEESVSHDGAVGDGYVLEQMFIRIKPNQLNQIAFAKKVDGRLGIVEFSIPYDKRESLRVLSDMLEELKDTEEQAEERTEKDSGMTQTETVMRVENAIGLSVNQILSMSKELGMNAEAFQVFILLGQKHGMSTEDMIKALRNLKQSVNEIKGGDAQKLGAMQRITGLSKEEITSMSLENLMEKIAAHSFKK
jgi:hypothetical protein